MKIGVIDVGGGLRGIYAAGVFDFCIENEIKFDYGIGISAGSANLASYMSGQRCRNRVYYSEYSMRREYMSFREFLLHGSFINLDYVYGTLSNSGGEYPLDYPKMMANPMEWYMEGTEAQTGRPHYFGRDDIFQDGYNVFKASCAIPFACRPQNVKGVLYYDGALGDPVPIRKAFEDGCDRVVLILTKPLDDVADRSDADRRLAWLIHWRYPHAARQLQTRAARYKEEIELAKSYAAGGRLLIVSPDDTCGIKTLTKDREALERLYHKGYADGRAILDFMQQSGDGE